MVTKELNQQYNLTRNSSHTSSKDQPVSQMSNIAFNPFSGPQIERVIYTTESQSEIWTACQLGGEDANRAYNESISLKITGEVSINAIEKAFHTLIQRHEVLRSVFSTDGRYMTIFKDLFIPLYYNDISGLQDNEKEEAISNYLHQDAQHIFSLVHGPLIKAGLIKVSDFKFRLVITAHHIICDGWSIGIMLQELGALYSAYAQDIFPNIPNPESFSRYANDQQNLINSSEYEKIEQFWLDIYKDPISELLLPIDFPYQQQRTYKSTRYDCALNTNLLKALKKTGLDTSCSLVSTLLSAFEIFLFKLTGQDDIALGLPVAGQSFTGMSQLVGHCVNLLPLRTKINSNLTFTEYLKARKSELFDAYDHQQLSFGQLLKKLSISRNPSRVPLVPVVFNMDLGMTDGVQFHNLSYELISNPREYETFEIFLNATGSDENLIFEWSFNTSLFKLETIQQMMVSFEKLINNLVLNPNISIAKIITDDYLNIYNKINNTQANYTNKSLHELILAKALETDITNREAIIFKETCLSYANLFQYVNQLSHYFKNQGIKNGDIIGVSLPRGQELPIVLLAIMQCGAIYLPLDPAYPQSRLKFMLEDSEAKLLITNQYISTSFPKETTKIYLDDVLKLIEDYPSTPIDSKVQDTSISYILYTSGSTGKPKGVAVTHKNLVNFLCSMADKPGIETTDKLLSITTISFDIAGLELFLPLLTGATLVIADDATSRDGRLLHELLIKEQITILQATPTTWQMLLDSGWKTPLPLKALCGGEALPLNLAQELVSKCDSLWNMYGPTETTIWSAVKQIQHNDTIITIGKPIANTQIYLLNEQGQLVPPGTIGEITIGGDGVALGYWKRPELTSEKFITSPFNLNENNIIYKTGDLGKLLSTGELLCLGRIDQQVKIRGHRIELGEIEQAISLLDDIHMAIVLANSDMLTAYVVPNIDLNENIAATVINEWKNALKTELPTHLIPNTFHLLDHLPTTLNGKIDRKALLDIKSLNTNNVTSYTAPRTKAEEIVSEIWQECLGLEKVDIFSNFFELGGHSLIAVKVMRLLEDKTGKRLPLSSLFEYSTIEKLAELLNLDVEIASDALVPIKTTGSKTPIYFIHGAGLNVLIFNELSKNLDKEQPAYALEGTRLNDIDDPLNSIEEIASYYIEAIIKVNPKGPYAIAGYSFGGIIAFEMGRQLMTKGKKVSMISILDTYVSPEYYFSSPLRKKLAQINFRNKRRFTFFKEMIESWEKAVMHINRKKNFIKEYYLNQKTFKTKEEEEEHKQFVISNAKVSKVAARYQITPSHLKIDLFKAKNNEDFIIDRTYLGWNKVALDGVNVHDIPGNHLNIFTQPNVLEFAKTLQKVLDERHANL
ncbi:MAG: non-ribosomal peptide synthetase [Flavobacteriales bacterium]